jgi:hypothetical protein
MLRLGNAIADGFESYRDFAPRAEAGGGYRRAPGGSTVSNDKQRPSLESGSSSCTADHDAVLFDLDRVLVDVSLLEEQQNHRLCRLRWGWFAKAMGGSS